MTSTQRTTTQRGDGRRHQVLRKRFAREVATGRVICWTCGERIHPTQARDLGHDDHDSRVSADQNIGSSNAGSQNAAA